MHPSRFRAKNITSKHCHSKFQSCCLDALFSCILLLSAYTNPCKRQSWKPTLVSSPRTPLQSTPQEVSISSSPSPRWMSKCDPRVCSRKWVLYARDKEQVTRGGAGQQKQGRAKRKTIPLFVMCKIKKEKKENFSECRKLKEAGCCAGKNRWFFPKGDLKVPKEKKPKCYAFPSPTIQHPSSSIMEKDPSQEKSWKNRRRRKATQCNQPPPIDLGLKRESGKFHQAMQIVFRCRTGSKGRRLRIEEIHMIKTPDQCSQQPIWYKCAFRELWGNQTILR